MSCSLVATPAAASATEDVGGAERGAVDRSVSEDGDALARLRDPLDLLGAILWEHFGADVLDVQRASDGVAGLSRVARHQHGLDVGVEQVLDGGARARPDAILEGDHADQPAAERDEHDRPTERLELAHAPLGRRDADPLLDEVAARPDAQLLSRAGDGHHPEADRDGRVAHGVRLRAARLRGAEDRLRGGAAIRPRRAGREAEDLGGVEALRQGLDLGHLGLAEEQRPPGAEDRHRRVRSAVPRVRALVRDPATLRGHQATRHRDAPQAADDAVGEPGLHRDAGHRRVEPAAGDRVRQRGRGRGRHQRPALDQRASCPSHGREGVYPAPRIERESREDAIIAGPGAAADEAPLVDARAGDDRIACSAANWRDRPEPGQDLGLALGDDHVHRDVFTLLDQHALARAQIEHALLGRAVLREAPTRDHHRALDPGALRLDPAASAFEQPGADGGHRSDRAGEGDGLLAERLRAPEDRPQRDADRPHGPRQDRERVRVGGVTRRRQRACAEHARADAGEHNAREQHDPATRREPQQDGEGAGDRAEQQQQRADVARLGRVRPRRIMGRDAPLDRLDQRTIVVEPEGLGQIVLGDDGGVGVRDGRGLVGGAGLVDARRDAALARPVLARRGRERATPGREERRSARRRVAKVVEPVVEDRDMTRPQRVEQAAATRAGQRIDDRPGCLQRGPFSPR